MFYSDLKTATNGRSNFLLKKSSVINGNRKPHKKFTADLSKVTKFKAKANTPVQSKINEEVKDEEEMN